MIHIRVGGATRLVVVYVFLRTMAVGSVLLVLATSLLWGF